MTIEMDEVLRLAGRVLVAGYPEAEPPARIRQALEEDALAGVILFRRNIDDPLSVAEVLRRTLASVDARVLVAVDQEGGRVERLKSPVLELPPMRTLGERDDVAYTRSCGEVLGRQLRALGFSMDFAPILDVDTNPDNPVIGDRSFGTTPDVVIRHASAFAEGLAAAPILSCGKHFPGHGDTDLDSHLALPKLSHDRARLDAVELAPFAASLSLPAWMTAHVVFEALDPGVPATLSPKVIQGLLREELGYQGVVISDDLEMKAVRDGWGVVKSAELAIEAGCDLLLVCSDVDACFEARTALAKRADDDAAFADRLRAAGDRVQAMRERCPARVADRATIDEALALTPLP